MPRPDDASAKRRRDNKILIFTSAGGKAHTYTRTHTYKILLHNYIMRTRLVSVTLYCKKSLK